MLILGIGVVFWLLHESYGGSQTPKQVAHVDITDLGMRFQYLAVCNKQWSCIVKTWRQGSEENTIGALSRSLKLQRIIYVRFYIRFGYEVHYLIN